MLFWTNADMVHSLTMTHTHLSVLQKHSLLTLYPGDWAVQTGGVKKNMVLHRWICAITLNIPHFVSKTLFHTYRISSYVNCPHFICTKTQCEEILRRRNRLFPWSGIINHLGISTLPCFPAINNVFSAGLC